MHFEFSDLLFEIRLGFERYVVNIRHIDSKTIMWLESSRAADTCAMELATQGRDLKRMSLLERRETTDRVAWA